MTLLHTKGHIGPNGNNKGATQTACDGAYVFYWYQILFVTGTTVERVKYCKTCDNGHLCKEASSL